MPSEDRILRNQIIPFLRGDGAHASFFSAVKNFPAEHYGTRPTGCPHTAWQLVEHIRIALHDLLDFCTNPNYTTPEWPADYWPKDPAPPSTEAWEKSVAAVRHDIEAFERLTGDPASNLYAEIPWGEGQTLLREILLAGDHTSYHTGQIVLIRQISGIWK